MYDDDHYHNVVGGISTVNIKLCDMMWYDCMTLLCTGMSVWFCYALIMLQQSKYNT